MKINDIAAGRDYIKALAKRAVCSTESRSAAQPAATQSFYGGSFYGAEGEAWPHFEGRPLIPWCYLSVTSLPEVPYVLRESEAVAFYINDDLCLEACRAAEGSSLVVREYRRGTRLTLLERPPTLEKHPPYTLEWRIEDDFPSTSHFYEALSDEVYAHFCDERKNEGLANHSGIKLGGWPTLVQYGYESFDLETWLMQIDMTENYI